MPDFDTAERLRDLESYSRERGEETAHQLGSLQSSVANISGKFDQLMSSIKEENRGSENRLMSALTVINREIEQQEVISDAHNKRLLALEAIAVTHEKRWGWVVKALIGAGSTAASLAVAAITKFGDVILEFFHKQ